MDRSHHVLNRLGPCVPGVSRLLARGAAVLVSFTFAVSAHADGGERKDGKRVLDATECVDVISIPKKRNGEDAHFKIKNQCTTRITVAWCRPPSALAKSRTTECGDGKSKGVFKQFVQLEPGEENGNPDNSPADVQPYFGACFGFGTLRHKMDGSYGCSSK